MSKVAKPDTQASRLAEIERRLSAVERSPQMPNASGQGGTFTWYTDDGVAVFYVGTQPNGDTGVTIFRENGTVAFRTSDPFGDTNQVVALYDRNGHAIIQDNWWNGEGLARPSIPVQWHRAKDPVAEFESTVSATFEDLFHFDFITQNPDLYVEVKAYASDGTTSGEIQVWDPFFSVSAGALLAVPIGTVTATTYSTSFGIGFPAHWTGRRYTLRARRTAGAGTLYVAMRQVRGA